MYNMYKGNRIEVENNFFEKLKIFLDIKVRIC